MTVTAINPRQELQALIDTIKDGTLVCVVLDRNNYDDSDPFTVIGRVRTTRLSDGGRMRRVGDTDVAYLDGEAHRSYSAVGVVRLTVVGAAS